THSDIDTLIPYDSHLMGSGYLQWALLQLVSAIVLSASSGMPITNFFRNMFIADDTEVEGGEVAMYEVVETRGDNHEDRGRGLQGQHFLLDSVLYSEFNAIGQAQFNILATKGLDSQCWRQAVASIEADCETMTHTRKQRLAVQLNNCHLQHAGRRPTRCGIRDSDEQCVQETQHDDVA
ncbi:unnamed protein product, partial [Ascophyllum nodosum]